jgi:hypothetical protein
MDESHLQIESDTVCHSLILTGQPHLLTESSASQQGISRRVAPSRYSRRYRPSAEMSTPLCFVRRPRNLPVFSASLTGHGTNLQRLLMLALRCYPYEMSGSTLSWSFRLCRSTYVTLEYDFHAGSLELINYCSPKALTLVQHTDAVLHACSFTM